MESQQGMFKLRQRLKKYIFLFPSIRQVMAIVRRKIPIFLMAKSLYLSNNTTHSTLLKMHAFRQVVVSKLC